MVVCKFFLQGSCRFGENCKFEHQLNEAPRGSATSILRQHTFPGNTNVNNIDTNTLVRSVQNDMVNAEKGGQWLLSSYAPFKDKPAFIGFEDRSFEEVRLGFYESRTNGTLEQFKQQVQMVLQDAASKIKALQNPSPELINVIKEIYNTAPTNTYGQQNMFRPSQPVGYSGANNTNTYGSSTFANQTNKNAFGQSTSGSSIFRGANSNVYGQQNPTYNPTSNQSNMGQNLYTNQTNPNQHSLFNTPKQTGSIFNAQPGYGGQQNNPLFPNASQNTSIFTAQQPGFGNPNPATYAPQSNLVASNLNNEQKPPFVPSQSGIFTSQQKNFFTQANNPPFALQNANYTPNQQQTPAAIYLQQQPPQAAAAFPPAYTSQQPNQASQFVPQQPFSQPQNPNIYGQQQVKPQSFQQQQQPPATTSIFASTTQPNQQINPQQISSSSNNVFGNVFATTPATTQSTFGSSPPVQIQAETMQYAYSKLEDLSEIDIKCFESNSFEFGKIPEKPPTFQMCS